MHLPSTTVNSSSGYCGAVIRVFRARKLCLLMTVVDQPLQSNRPRGTRDPGPGSAGIAPLRPRRTSTSCTCTTHLSLQHATSALSSPTVQSSPPSSLTSHPPAFSLVPTSSVLIYISRLKYRLCLLGISFLRHPKAPRVYRALVWMNG